MNYREYLQNLKEQRLWAVSDFSTTDIFKLVIFIGTMPREYTTRAYGHGRIIEVHDDFAVFSFKVLNSEVQEIAVPFSQIRIIKKPVPTEPEAGLMDI